ncbi:MAG TPA: hypothetical protein VF627_11045, partial [Abditibacterium sp.]
RGGADASFQSAQRFFALSTSLAPHFKKCFKPNLQLAKIKRDSRCFLAQLVAPYFLKASAKKPIFL